MDGVMFRIAEINQLSYLMVNKNNWIVVFCVIAVNIEILTLSFTVLYLYKQNDTENLKFINIITKQWEENIVNNWNS